MLYAVVVRPCVRAVSNRALYAITLCAAAWLLVGCESSGPLTQRNDPTPQAITTLEEHLVRAARAEDAGDRERARELYRAASKAYPVAEAPWQKLAQSYFNAGDYGNAIQAAQEVLQRDPKDPTAASVLAISGLRLSSQALGILREQAQAVRSRSGSQAQPMTNAPIVVAARLEAETLARELREVLGEGDAPRPRARSTAPAPAARPSPSAAPVATTTPARGAAPRTTPAPAATPAAALPQRPTAAVPATPRPAPAAAPAAPAARSTTSPSASPFDKLR